MENEEKKAWITCAVSMIAILVEAFMCFVRPNLGAETVFADAVEEFSAEESKTDLSPLHDCENGMPCENREQFERWYAEYEQAASEEEGDGVDSGSVEADAEISTADAHSESTAVEYDTTLHEEIQASVSDSPAKEAVVYQIDGDVIDPEIQKKLHDTLEKYGIGYWFTGALAQMYQESSGNPFAVNQRNHEDMGLFQFKNRFWDWNEGDIFSVDAQINRYCREMAARFNAGLSVDEAISRHNTSDFVTEINWQYVADVKQHLNSMSEVR